MKENRYIEILRWTYDKRFEGFSEGELFLKFNPNNTEEFKKWYLYVFRGNRNNEDCLIGLYDYKDNTHYLCLTAKGLSAAIDYLSLEGAREMGKKADAHALQATCFATAALTLGILGAYWQFESNAQTRRALELSASPILTVTLDRSSVPEETDETTVAAGLLPTEGSLLKLLLVNNSVSAIEQVDMRMTLWKLYVNKENRHLTVCPLGYVNHDNNPSFTISNLGTRNLFNKKFALKENQEYPFSINLSNLDKIQLIPDNAQILLKIDVNYVKTVSQSSRNYVKLYVLNSFAGYAVDTEIAPTLALGLADRKEDVEVEGFKFPSLVSPFQEEEFLSYFEKPSPELDLTPGACREFSLSKEQRTIFY